MPEKAQAERRGLLSRRPWKGSCLLTVEISQVLHLWASISQQRRTDIQSWSGAHEMCCLPKCRLPVHFPEACISPPDLPTTMSPVFPTTDVFVRSYPHRPFPIASRNLRRVLGIWLHTILVPMKGFFNIIYLSIKRPNGPIQLMSKRLSSHTGTSARGNSPAAAWLSSAAAPSQFSSWPPLDSSSARSFSRLEPSPLDFELAKLPQLCICASFLKSSLLPHLCVI